MKNSREDAAYGLRRHWNLSEQQAKALFGPAGRAPTQRGIDTYGQ